MSLIPFNKPATVHPVDLVPKYVIMYSNSTNISIAHVILEYNDNTGDKDIVDIDTNYSVPSVGMTTVDITYANFTTYLRETINVDTTNSLTFWTDIKNWLFLNNFFDISISSGKYLINDPDNYSYIILSV